MSDAAPETERTPEPKPESKLTRFLREHRARILRIGVELLVVFIGVTAAFALENWRSNAEEDRYRRQMIAALSQSVEGLAAHNLEIQTLIETRTSAFEAALARGERPAPPIYREEGAERPPRVWDGIVATGVARALPPDLYFRLVEYFNRVDAFGDRYARYVAFTEERVLPNLNGDDTSAFYTANGELRGEYREYVNRLHDLADLCELMTQNAESVQAELNQQVGREP